MIQNIKNNQLRQDIDRLSDYDDISYSDITTDFDSFLGFILYVADNSYFYEYEADRDSDCDIVCKLLLS